MKILLDHKVGTSHPRSRLRFYSKRSEEMARYPFGEYATAYMESMKGIYADSTWKIRSRRYRRMERKLIELKEKKMISTLSPKSMTEQDVKE